MNTKTFRMENKEKNTLSTKIVGKEYQTPELVDLNVISTALGGAPSCGSGSSGNT
jgi:hypothetical protein